MDLKKVFDQTVREIKREVNKKVLKVPEMEQKVLEATSNEPWGPHGTIMADIAQATRNYQDYQMIMGILWRRLNDSGRNWRHVYKALTVLEFLVGNGAERVIDELREHAYQLQTLVDFQYVEAGGKDQGLNVRRKAQGLVGLINDTEKIREVRQKAAANRDKYRGISSTGGIYRSGSYSSSGGSYGGDRDDGRYGSGGRYGGRDDDKYGGSRDKDYESYRDEDRYSRDGDRYGRDGDRYRDNDFGNDKDHDDDRRYGSRAVDRYSDKFESNMKDRDRDRSYEDDDKYSTKSGGRADDYVHDERRADRTHERSKGSAPPSYEDVSTANSPPYSRQDDRSSESGLASAVAKATKVASQLRAPPSTVQPVASKLVVGPSLATSKSTEDFDDFDPRGSSVAPAPAPAAAAAAAAPAPAPAAATIEQDLFGEIAPQPPPATLPKYGSGMEDLFGASTVQSSSVANLETNENLFESSAFIASASGPSNFTTPAGSVFPPSATLATVPSNDFSSFTAAPTHSHTVTPNSFDTVPLSNFNVNNFNAPVDNFNAISTAPSNSSTQSGSEFFGDSPFSAFGAPTTAKVENNSNPAALQTSNGVGTAKPQADKKKFEPKSSVWADHLSSGLLDINIAKPRNNPLAELGIHLDSSLTGTERKREVTSAPPAKGRAMGSGSGLGIVGASILTPPPAPPVMGGGIGLGPGGGMGMAPGMNMGMGYGMNPGFGMPPRMGMNPGLGPGAGLSMNPAMMQGTGPGPAMGMGMNSTFGMGTGVGGYPYQQNYGGFR